MKAAAGHVFPIVFAVLASCSAGGGDDPVTDEGQATDLAAGDEGCGDCAETGDADTGDEVPDTVPGDDGVAGDDLASVDVPAKLELPPQCFDDKHCDDEDPCTNDVCNEDKQCEITPLDCDDGDQCTEDACDPESGCTHVNVPGCIPSKCVTDADCTDLNGCTLNEKCVGGKCEYDMKECPDDGKQCTVNVCDPPTGECIKYVDCEDNDACTKDWCDPQKEFSCRHSVDKCDDSIDCTLDSCDSQTGCKHELADGCQPLCVTDADCDDGNQCTGDECVGGACRNNPPGECCKHAADCYDGDPCTVDWCTPPMKGQCVNLVLPGCPYQP